jgi:hypothetical protein
MYGTMNIKVIENLFRSREDVTRERLHSSRALRAKNTHDCYICVLISAMTNSFCRKKGRGAISFTLLPAEQLSATMNTI